MATAQQQADKEQAWFAAAEPGDETALARHVITWTMQRQHLPLC